MTAPQSDPPDVKAVPDGLDEEPLRCVHEKPFNECYDADDHDRSVRPTPRGNPMSVYNVPQRPRTRGDGWPTRADIRYDTDPERLCRVLVGIVEQMGASQALTQAVMLLDQARNAIADHVERRRD